MPYVFPRTRPRAGDFIEADALTEHYSLASEVVANVSECNVKSHTTDADKINSIAATFFQYQLDGTATTLGLGAADVGARANYHNVMPVDYAAIPSGSFILQNSFEWAVVHEFTEFEAGLEFARVVASFNYCWIGFDNVISPTVPAAQNHAWASDLFGAAGTNYYTRRAANIQFAVRINGTIVFQTGADDPYFRDQQGVRSAKDLQNGDSGLPGFMVLKDRRAIGPGSPMGNVVLNVGHMVQPTREARIEVLVRRLPRLRADRIATGNRIILLNRQCFLQRTLIRPVRSVTVTPASVSRVVERGSLLPSNLLSSRNTLKTAVNDIPLGNIRQNSLNQNQVRSPVGYTSTGDIAANAGDFAYLALVQNVLPDEFDNSTFTDSVTGVAWHMVQESAGVRFKLPPQVGNWVASNALVLGVYEVSGRIQIAACKNSAFAESAANQSLYEHIHVAIFYEKTGGTQHLIPLSSAAVARMTSLPGTATDLTQVGGKNDQKIDVAILGLLDLRSSQLDEDIDHFGIAVAVSNSRSKDATNLGYSRGSLSATFWRSI